VTETEAVAALCAGDERGFEALVEMFEHRAFAVAVVMVRDPSLANDIVSEAFLKAFRARARLDPQFGFWPWLLKIVENEALTAVRRRTRRERLEAMLMRLPLREDDPVAEAESHDLARWLLSAIRQLSAGEREVMYRRFLLDLDENSIAKELGCPLGTVKTRIRRGRKHLRDRALKELDAYLPEPLGLGANTHV
jgi:RNA polymerase sigma-70 factor (ECF subfamily)